MPHGAPDWSNVVKYTQVHRLDDMAELACRLGSIIIFDRRGDVIWYDSFQYGYQYYDRWLSGAGASMEITTESFRNHGYALKLVPGSDEGQAAVISQYFPLIKPGNHGCEFSWTLDSYVRSIDLTIISRDSGVKTTFKVSYNYEEKKLYYLDKNNTLSILDDELDLPYAFNLFHTWKLVWNTTTGFYIRLLLNTKTYNMEGLEGYITTTTEPDYYSIHLGVYSQYGYNPFVYFDDIIHTINEL